MHTYRDNYKYKYISSATTTDVLNGQGSIIRIIIGETAAGAITVYDEGTGGTTNVISVLKASVAEGTYEFNARVFEGIQIVTAAASKLTVVYSTL